MKQKTTPNPNHPEHGEVILYRSLDGSVKLDVHLDQETVWLTQAQMALLFERERSVITKHLRNVFSSDELARESNVQKMHIAGSDKPVEFYNSWTATSALPTTPWWP